MASRITGNSIMPTFLITERRENFKEEETKKLIISLNAVIKYISVCTFLDYSSLFKFNSLALSLKNEV